MTDWENTLSGITDALPKEASEILKKAGITGADFSGLFRVEFSDVLRTVSAVFSDKIHAPFSLLGTGIFLLLLLGLFGTFGKDGKETKLRETVGVLFLITVSAAPLYTAVHEAVSAVQTCGAFMCALIPVLAAAAAASGSPLFSVCWNTAVFSAAQTVSAAASGFMAPCCGLMLGTGVLDCLSPGMQPPELSAKIRKASTWIFSAVSTLFTAFLTLKSTLAGTADSLAAKGIRLAVSSFVPVIGAQLSEAYSAVTGSLAAVRSTAGVFAVAGVCAVVLPAALQMLLYVAVLRLLHLIAVFFGQKNAAAFVQTFADAVSMLHACLLFVTALFVVCIGLILKVKGGA